MSEMSEWKKKNILQVQEWGEGIDPFPALKPPEEPVRKPRHFVLEADPRNMQAFTANMPGDETEETRRQAEAQAVAIVNGWFYRLWRSILFRFRVLIGSRTR